MSSNKKARTLVTIPIQNKQARHFLQPDINKFVWAIRSDKTDWNHEYFGFNETAMNQFCNKIKPKLDDYTSMKWVEVIQRQSCHTMNAENLEKPLRDRLEELYGEDAPETLYQIDLDGTHRIWGYKNESIFYILFNDPDHKGYIVQKRHT